MSEVHKSGCPSFDDDDWNAATAQNYRAVYGKEPQCKCGVRPPEPVTSELCWACFGGGCEACEGAGVLPLNPERTADPRARSDKEPNS